MRAEFVDQAEPALAVAQCEQPLGEQLHPHRRAFGLGQLLGQQRGQPVAAEQGAAGRAGAGVGEQIVLLFAQHRQASIKSGGGAGRRA